MKIILNLLLILFFTGSFAQFSVSTETKYLQLINNQNRKDLIEDNLFNAEFASDSIIIKQKQSYENSMFFYQLAVSYFKTKNHELAMFTLLRQRCLFPDKNISITEKNLFFETAYRNNLSNEQAQYLWQQSSTEEKIIDFNNRLLLCLNLSTSLYKRKLTKYIYKLGLIYRSFEKNIPVWYQHWEFLSIINIKEKNKKQIMPLIADNKETVLKSLENNKLRYKVYRKTINHYRKINGFVMADKYLSEYRKEKELPLILKIDAMFKKFRIGIKKLFV